MIMVVILLEKWMFYQMKIQNNSVFIDDVHEINNQSRCILSGPTLYKIV